MVYAKHGIGVADFNEKGEVVNCVGLDTCGGPDGYNTHQFGKNPHYNVNYILGDMMSNGDADEAQDDDDNKSMEF